MSDWADGLLSGVADVAGVATTGVPWGSVLNAGASLYSANSTRQGQQDANALNLQIANQNSAFNASEAQKTRDWETQMSNTAYQRASSDMTAAGLNPVLMFSRGGASTPTGATGYAASPPPMLNTAAAGMQGGVAATQAYLNSAHATKAAAETTTERERPDLLREQKFHMGFQNAELLARAGLETAEIRKVDAEVSKVVAETDLTEVQTKVVWETIARTIAETKSINADVIRTNLESSLMRLQVPEAKAFADYFSTAVGRAAPYVREAGGVVSSAAKAYGASKLGTVVNRFPTRK